MNRLQSIWEMYGQLPRAARWGVAALVSVVLFLVWNDVVLNLTGQLNREADRLLAEYERAAGNQQRLKNLRAVQDVVRGLGEVARPGREGDAETAFNNTVNSVLKRFTVSNDSFSYRGGSPMKRGTLSKIVRYFASLSRSASSDRLRSRMSLIAPSNPVGVPSGPRTSETAWPMLPL